MSDCPCTKCQAERIHDEHWNGAKALGTLVGIGLGILVAWFYVPLWGIGACYSVGQFCHAIPAVLRP